MRKLGRYLLLDRLGAGSFATVWKAYDPELDTEVAVKVLAENWAANADVRERFLAEARLLRRIASPRVVRVHDVGVQEDRPYFVMDYVRGGTLADRVGGCDPQEALRLAAEAGYAVQVLHEAGVVHRDVKPSNLLLATATASAPAAVLVADLGSAKQMADASGLTVTTGTPAYMAPEQAFQTGGFDGRADVYALAVVAYELLTGQKPFGPGGRATALMTDRPAASTLPALPAGQELPPGVALLLRTAMSVEPADRPPTAQAFADALLAPVPQPRPQPQERPGRLTLRAVCLASGAVFTATTLLSWLHR
nr:serine/threonine protein kinase [Streptomyces sp. NBC_00899]